jgi:hypothetical protein
MIYLIFWISISQWRYRRHYYKWMILKLIFLLMNVQIYVEYLLYKFIIVNCELWFIWYFELVFHNEDTEDIIINEWYWIWYFYWWMYKFMLNICCNNCEWWIFIWYFELVFHNEDTEDIIINEWYWSWYFYWWMYKFMLNICCNNCE